MKFKSVFFITAFLTALMSSCSKLETKSDVCPSSSKLKSSLEKVAGSGYEIVYEKPSKEMPGICQVIVKQGVRPIVFFTNKDASYILVGNLIDTKTGENLTEKLTSNYRALKNQKESSLSNYVAFTYGNGPKYVYFITDPKCPFCHGAEPMIKKWADKNSVQIRVVLFPLPIHPGAFEEAVGIVCHYKNSPQGWEALRNAYTAPPLSQCDSGKAFVEDTMNYLENDMHIEGTPILIGMNGKMQIGAPSSEKDLDKLIN